MIKLSLLTLSFILVFSSSVYAEECPPVVSGTYRCVVDKSKQTVLIDIERVNFETQNALSYKIPGIKAGRVLCTKESRVTDICTMEDRISDPEVGVFCRDNMGEYTLKISTSGDVNSKKIAAAQKVEVTSLINPGLRVSENLKFFLALKKNNSFRISLTGEIDEDEVSFNAECRP